jgi:2-hydroxyacyl-CoA lyase 1
MFIIKMEAHVAKYVVPFNFMTSPWIIRDVILAEGSPAPVVVSEGANTMDVGRVVLVQKLIFDYSICAENIIKR